MACADRPSGKAIAILAGHGAGIEAWDLINGRRLWRVRTRVRTKWKAAGLCWPRSVTAVATTTLPDDRLVALSGGSDGTVRIWDLSTGEQVGTNMNCRVRGQPSPAAVSAIACTRLPDGRVVAIVGSENTTPATVTAWDLSTCRLLARSTIRTGWVDHAVCVMFPDGMPMAVTGDTVLRVWPLVGLAPDVEWEPKFEIDLDAPVTALASDGAGKLLAGTMHGLVQLHLRSDSESCGGS
ncbi:WD40 repeat domain-containing protein [Amycolatopsis sp. WAC 01375]|uniref:WD40 repeat domain-containing protein n=1 Tax=Amycolatopsis sp. WAC 01375 TaxID=2203194 RepID=UPI00351118B9